MSQNLSDFLSNQDIPSCFQYFIKSLEVLKINYPDSYSKIDFGRKVFMKGDQIPEGEEIGVFEMEDS